MKKLLVTVFVLSLVLALSACSADDVSRLKSFVAGLDEQKVADTINDLQKLAPADATVPQTTHPTNEKTFITRDRAIELALNHAGLTKAQVRDLEAELDYERTGVFWEVDFESGGYEYSYDINAETEAIAKVEKERD